MRNVRGVSAKKKFFPFPEAITKPGAKPDDRPWVIGETPVNSFVGGGVNQIDKNMFVPVDDSEQSLNIRAHEQAHIKWTPKCGCPRDLNPIIYNKVEDWRIHRLLTLKADYDLTAGLMPQDILDMNIKEFTNGEGRTREVPAEKMVLQLIGSHGTGDFKQLYDAMHHAYIRAYQEAQKDSATEEEQERADDYQFAYETYDEASRYLYNDKDGRKDLNPSHKKTLEISKWLQEVFAARQAYKEMMEAIKNGKKLSKEEAEKLMSVKKPSTEYIPGGNPRKGALTPWEDFKIEPERLTKKNPFSNMHKKFIGMEYGAVPRSMHRWTSDKKIFGFKKKIPGGSVLVDGSGSMRWRKEDLMEVVKLAPAATIAIYSSSGSGGGLRILAKNGKMVEDNLIASPFGGGNGVDGPSLRWLAEQPEPRYWVSDGQVTGSGDCTHEELTRECNIICATNGIRRLPNNTAAVAEFKRLAGNRKGAQI